MRESSRIVLIPTRCYGVWLSCLNSFWTDVFQKSIFIRLQWQKQPMTKWDGEIDLLQHATACSLTWQPFLPLRRASYLLWYKEHRLEKKLSFTVTLEGRGNWMCAPQYKPHRGSSLVLLTLLPTQPASKSTSGSHHSATCPQLRLASPDEAFGNGISQSFSYPKGSQACLLMPFM